MRILILQTAIWTSDDDKFAIASVTLCIQKLEVYAMLIKCIRKVMRYFGGSIYDCVKVFIMIAFFRYKVTFIFSSDLSSFYHIVASESVKKPCIKNDNQPVD